MPSLITRAVHRAIVTLAFLPWLLGVFGFWVALLMVILADKLWPNANMGNCWSFAGPRWAKYGGYLLIRPADGVRAVGVGKVPHAIWVKTLSGASELEQSAPVERYEGRWLLWKKFYFEHNVTTSEEPHDAVKHEAS